jgi:hypothetical protein
MNHKWLTAALTLTALALVPVSAFATGSFGDHGETRVYWIKAEEIFWDYTPSFPINLMSGEPFTDDQLVFLDPAPDRIGHIYIKAVYRRYSPGFDRLIDGPNEVLDPDTGEMLIVRPPGSRREHLGLLGPVIRAEVGDTIIVHFRNETRFPVGVHPHGVFYAKDSEGAPYDDGTSGADKEDDAVPTGGEHTYTWQVPLRAGPGPNDPDSILWEYHSHTSETADTNAGLIGPMIIYAPGKMSYRTPDREFISIFNIYDENSSSYLDANIERFTTVPVDPDDEDFGESNLMHSINGLLFGNLRGLRMRLGDLVRWYIFGMGTEVDIHTPHWHGATVLHNGNRIDVTEIFPAVAKQMDMRPDDPGTWMYHCHVNDHLDAGMITTFTVLH